MTTKEIADRLVVLCREGQWDTAQKELYADDAISIEPYATEHFSKETKGLQQIIEKGRRFSDMVETMHSITVSDPIIAENSFACSLSMDATYKGRGRMAVSEISVYQVKDGKVISEQFFV